MAMYGVAFVPLISKVSDDKVLHKWYADDGNAAGSLTDPRTLLDALIEHGPKFGYNVIKTTPDHQTRQNR